MTTAAEFLAEWESELLAGMPGGGPPIPVMMKQIEYLANKLAELYAWRDLWLEEGVALLNELADGSGLAPLRPTDRDSLGRQLKHTVHGKELLERQAREKEIRRMDAQRMKSALDELRGMVGMWANRKDGRTSQPAVEGASDLGLVRLASRALWELLAVPVPEVGEALLNQVFVLGFAAGEQARYQPKAELKHFRERKRIEAVKAALGRDLRGEHLAPRYANEADNLSDKSG